MMLNRIILYIVFPCTKKRSGHARLYFIVVLVRCKLNICLMIYTGIATWSTQVSEDNYHEEYMAFIKFKLHL